MKTNFAFGRCVSLIALVATVLPLSALAGGMTEAQLIGTYQACLIKQTVPLFAVVFDETAANSAGSQTPDDLSNFHKPLIGHASLNFIQDFSYTDAGSFNVLKRSTTHFQYHRGRLQISLLDNVAYRPIDLPYNGDDIGDVFLKTKPMLLPYFEYSDKHLTSRSYDNLGNAHTEESDVISEKPRLMVYQGPNELPFLNDQTGQPFRNSSGKPITLNVGEYRSCLNSYVNKAYARPAKAEVAASSAKIESAPGTKRVAENANDGRDTLPAAVASQTSVR